MKSLTKIDEAEKRLRKRRIRHLLGGRILESFEMKYVVLAFMVALGTLAIAPQTHAAVLGIELLAEHVARMGVIRFDDEQARVALGQQLVLEAIAHPDPAELGVLVPLVACLLFLSAWPAAITDRSFTTLQPVQQLLQAFERTQGNFQHGFFCRSPRSCVNNELTVRLP